MLRLDNISHISCLETALIGFGPFCFLRLPTQAELLHTGKTSLLYTRDYNRSGWCASSEFLCLAGYSVMNSLS